MLAIGRVVSTSYATGPYRITNISEICSCGDYEEAHYHVMCKSDEVAGTFYLNGYRADGAHVKTDDYLIFHPVAVGENYDLFAV